MLQLLIRNMACSAVFICCFFTINQAQAATVTIIDDSWVNWPGYTSSKGDEIGNPKIDKMRVTVGDNNILEKVELLWRPNSGDYTRVEFDSLFINSYDITTTNTSWDDWDYLIHDGGKKRGEVNGKVPDDGIWMVKNNYKYTTVKSSGNRKDNPNGIDKRSLQSQQSFSSNLTFDPINGVLTYDLASFGIASESGFFIAYAPYCANDVLGGHVSVSAVPVPPSVVLFVSGLLGLIGYGRRKQRV